MEKIEIASKGKGETSTQLLGSTWLETRSQNGGCRPQFKLAAVRCCSSLKIGNCENGCVRYHIEKEESACGQSERTKEKKATHRARLQHTRAPAKAKCHFQNESACQLQTNSESHSVRQSRECVRLAAATALVSWLFGTRQDRCSGRRPLHWPACILALGLLRRNAFRLSSASSIILSILFLFTSPTFSTRLSLTVATASQWHQKGTKNVPTSRSTAQHARQTTRWIPAPPTPNPSG